MPHAQLQELREMLRAFFHLPEDAIALSSRESKPVTAASVRIGVPIAPNATGAVLAINARPAASRGGNPSPSSSAAEIATGVPKPAAPSMNAPKEKAIRSACIRRSADRWAIEARITANFPVMTVRLYRKMAFRMIQPIGRIP